MQISGATHPFEVIKVTSNTAITLNVPWTGDTTAGLSYVLYQDEIPLFPDLQDIRKMRIPGIQMQRQPLPSSINTVDEKRDLSPFRTSIPQLYTLHDRGIYTEKTWATFNLNTDFWEDALDDVPRNEKLVIWPGIRVKDYTVYIRYTMILPPMSADSDEPPIPYGVRAVLVYGVLREHFLQNRDVVTTRGWNEEYDLLKTKMSADVESVDDELILTVDRRDFSRRSRYITHEEYYSS